jgi:hypothetical protein
MTPDQKKALASLRARCLEAGLILRTASGARMQARSDYHRAFNPNLRASRALAEFCEAQRRRATKHLTYKRFCIAIILMVDIAFAIWCSSNVN